MKSAVSAKQSFLECIGTVTMMTVVKMTKLETWYIVTDGDSGHEDGGLIHETLDLVRCY